MDRAERIQGRIKLGAAMLVALVATGCANFPRSPEPAPTPEPAPAPPSIVKETLDPAPPPPKPEPVPVPAPVVEPVRIAVLLSEERPAYRSVADALVALGLEPQVLTVSDTPDPLSNVKDADVLVAVGLRATVVAKSQKQWPVVFCQVFNLPGEELDSPQIRGVASIPPLASQLVAWRAQSPELRSIGAIVGEGHDGLMIEAGDAAGEAGISFTGHVAQSDREALYLFTRMVPEIDGYWLFPDNRILSATSLRQLFRYAATHGVEVAVFNDSLLSLGASISTEASPNDIAAKVADVAEAMAKGKGEGIPVLTPLSEVNVEFGPQAAQQASSDRLVQSP